MNPIFTRKPKDKPATPARKVGGWPEGMTDVGPINEEDVDRNAFGDYQAQLSSRAEERAIERQHSKGKNTARERIEMLVDPNTFMEIGQFMGGNIADQFLGSAVVTGFGEISGRTVAVYSQDFSVQGGTLGEVEGNKIIALMDRAMELKVPIVALVDSGGARIQEGVAALSQYGRIFKKTVQASGFVPQVSVILGPCAGGAVYCPALTDFIVMTRDNSHMFVTGPDVVRAVTGEDVSSADLGGAHLHNAQSGVAHYLAEDEADALDYVRTLLMYIPSNCDDAAPTYAYQSGADDAQDASRLGAIVPNSPKQPYDIVDVIENIVDHREFIQVHESFARNVVVGFACMEGESVGIIANQPAHEAGTLDVDASEKAARFVTFCDAFGIPIVTLVDVPGYRPGAEQEEAGIIRRGAKLIYSYTSATVPMVTVILRKAYGGAFIVMGSKSVGADFAFAWPGAEIAVLGADGAVPILHRRELAAAAKEGKNVDKLRAQLGADFTERNVNPNLSLEKGELDAIITPDSTRQTIVDALSILRSKDRSHPGPKRHGNGPL